MEKTKIKKSIYDKLLSQDEWEKVCLNRENFLIRDYDAYVDTFNKKNKLKEAASPLLKVNNQVAEMAQKLNELTDIRVQLSQKLNYTYGLISHLRSPLLDDESMKIIKENNERLKEKINNDHISWLDCELFALTNMYVELTLINRKLEQLI